MEVSVITIFDLGYILEFIIYILACVLQMDISLFTMNISICNILLLES